MALTAATKPSLPYQIAHLAPGYYRVRKGSRWIIARWRPSSQRWTSTFGAAYVPLYFDEIAEKVA